MRLQARRSEEEETRTALYEAERRVRSIAVVHEVLSREPGEEVVFDEIVRSLVLLVEDTVLALHPVEIVVNGELGVLSTDLATPLAVALAELLTNAVEHAFIDFGGADKRPRRRRDAQPLSRRRSARSPRFATTGEDSARTSHSTFPRASDFPSFATSCARSSTVRSK